MQVLCALARAQGRVVSRDDLIDSCWDGRIVGDDAITRCITRLRQIAQVEPGCFEIKTLMRVGYQLTADEALNQTEVALPPPTSALKADLVRGPSKLQFSRLFATFACAAVFLATISTLALFKHASPRWQIDQIKPFVTTEGEAASPTLSPNGDMVAYSAADFDGVPHIFLRNTTGGERTQLTHGQGETMPKWLPTGGRLAFRTSALGEPCRIMVMVVPTGSPRELLTCRYQGGQPYAFSPDGRALFYSDSDSVLAPDHLMRLDLASGTRTPLTDHSERALEDTVGEVSPSGRYVAFQRTLGPTTNALMVLDLRSGGTRTLWQVETDKWDAIAWLDDRTMLTAWRRADDRALVVVPMDGARTRLTSSTQAFFSLSRDKDGVFAAQTNFAVQSLVSLRADGTQETHLSSEGLIADPAFAADGSLAFIADSAGEQGLWIARPGKKPVRIAGFGARQAYHPAWSPDDKLITVTQVIDRVPHLRFLDADGTTPRDISLPGLDAGRSIWSRDGKQVTVLDYDEVGYSLLHVDVATERVSRTRLGEWSQIQMDGDSIYAIREGPGAKRPIWRIFPDKRLITDELEMKRLGDWTVFRGDLYFVKRVNEAHDELIRRTVDGKPIQTWNLGVTPWLGGLAIDPRTGLPALVQVSGGNDSIYLMRTSH